MSDLTPTTDQIRDLYELGAQHPDLPEVDIPAALAMFDRWLESVKREAAAVALEEAWKLRRGADRLGVESVPADWLLELAATTRNPRTPGGETSGQASP